MTRQVRSQPATRPPRGQQLGQPVPHRTGPAKTVQQQQNRLAIASTLDEQT